MLLSSVQFSRSVVSCSLQPHGLQQASLSITNSRSLLELMSIKSVMPSNHLILCCPLLLLPSVFPCIRVFSSESESLILCIRWPKYWSFSFSISPFNECSGLRPESGLNSQLGWKKRGKGREMRETRFQRSFDALKMVG